MRGAQLKRKSRKQLLALAEAAGIQTRRRATKAELIRAIVAGAGGRLPGRVAAADLPSEYGRTLLVLMEIEPRLIHAYWEVTPRDFKSAMSRLGPASVSAPWILRFYDVTYIHFDGTNAHGCFDVPVDLAPGSWYIRLWEGEKTYFAEIGPRTADGGLIPVCRSNPVHVPRSSPSPHYQPQWLKVDHKSGLTEVAEEPLPEGGAAELIDSSPVVISGSEPEQLQPPSEPAGTPEPEQPGAQLQRSFVPQPKSGRHSERKSHAPDAPAETAPGGRTTPGRPPAVFSSESMGSYVLGGDLYPSQRVAVAGEAPRAKHRNRGRWVKSGEEAGGFVLQISFEDE
jgi:hypothetical protein